MKKTVFSHVLLCGVGVALAALSAGAQSLLVINQGDKDMSIVDPATGKQVATVDEGVTDVHVHEVAASSDGKTAWMPIYGSTGVGHAGIDGHEMIVVDLASRKIIGHVDWGHGVRPHDPVFDRKRDLLYVTTELDKAVTVINPKTMKIVGQVPTGQPESHMLALSHDGRLGYTANVGPGTVSVLDMVHRKLITVIPISANTQRISISPNDKWVFTSDQTKPQLAVIDTVTNKVTKWVPLPGKGYGTASTLDGRWLLVAVPHTNQVAVVDLNTMQVVRSIDVPKAPQEILVRPDDKVAYVSCSGAGQVAAIDLTDWKVTQTIDAGRGSDGLAWAK
ncbi:cytochrome D1 domain-containing protein [Paracidobacterium acidisoli]|uniref:YNCE-like beta-propeller domain-containing protein n=1 Tax=Paracidobacterium acidisoli TaxID=2303751 RepID=A0A372INX9_9BACT|nr:cytochrome D1 domain-containing protein [Paracidobacterium acidisoli]MBT9330936.1 beta-propeller fold lactonase family protein [Paracidobacterium acidisoli]